MFRKRIIEDLANQLEFATDSQRTRASTIPFAPVVSVQEARREVKFGVRGNSKGLGGRCEEQEVYRVLEGKNG